MLARWWCGAGGQIILWTQLSHFPSWHIKYVIEKISDVMKETLAKNVKDFKSNLQKKHTAAH